MGKCSGLKGGGHHRKALDVADKKRKQKVDRKKEQELVGQRAVILQEILTRLDPDCDVYLDANDNKNSMQVPEFCRSHFRYENCSNRRCKFSHEHSIAEALGNVISGRVEHNGEENSSTIPGLRLISGIIGDRGLCASRRRRDQQQRSRRKQQTLTSTGDDTSDLQSMSPFENALSEGSSSVDTIVTYLKSDLDVLNLALSCRHLQNLVLIGGGNGNGEGCKDVQRRKYRAKETKLQQRNTALLETKSVAGRLRYAVSYVETNINVNNCLKSKNKHKNQKAGSKANRSNLRPILVYDHENPHVFQAFRESGIKLNIENLPSVLS